MKLALIAAHDPNLVIGKDGDLPWHYPEDMKHFKKTTMGHPVLMGRGEFEELGEKPLPGRENVVLSRSKEYEHVPTFSSIDKALEYLQDHDLVFVIGGGEIYKQTIDRADKLVLTEIHKEYEGDTYFPEYRDDVSTIWKETRRDAYRDFTIVEYKRK
ncbi:dihydrofolate reductase [Aliifodinibius sp. S!AR15-10]|uniref:dihydrofolate reductase n=1 Tax=Aliifodinibius sp. S!AR15-10 TaxID=2950437 RepID=UPI002858A906|nr:dihydrofolate reductase [Aliifodinibius sp. S!AR15-10]MDR8394034.1 dihydrofolate reductase [Aliifodinibius sp. S!AR15-10]